MKFMRIQISRTYATPPNGYQTLLGFTWHYRKTDQQTIEVADATATTATAVASAAVLPAAVVQQYREDEDVVIKILGPAEWLT